MQWQACEARRETCVHTHSYTHTHTHTHIIIKVKWANSWAFWILPYWKMSVAKAIECRQTRFSMKMRALAFGANNHSDNKYHDNDNLHSYHFCHFHQCSLLSFIPAWQIILIHGKLRLLSFRVWIHMHVNMCANLNFSKICLIYIIPLWSSANSEAFRRIS